MIAVKDRRSGETHRGRSPESIARRLYGRRAVVQYSPDPNTPWQAQVIIWQPMANASSVEADWYLDKEARAAAEPREEA